MSHGHDVYENSEARWYSAFLSIHGYTRVVYAFAMSLEDAKQAMVGTFGAVGIVTPSDGPQDRVPFLITESAQATRRIVV